MGAPTNGITEVAGPEQFRLDALVRLALAADGDPRDVVADPAARYFGALLSERTLVPGPDAVLFETGFQSWASARRPVR